MDRQIDTDSQLNKQIDKSIIKIEDKQIDK